MLTPRDIDTASLFRDVIEPLCDAFDPTACDEYVRLFAPLIERTTGRQTRRAQPAEPFRGETDRVRNVFVLSRVTLGADVAVTSVVLEAMKRRFPGAAIGFVGPGKNFELFDADPRLVYVPAAYGRGADLAARLEASFALRAQLDQPDSIVVDPDSRLTQLGLVPVCDDARYYFFEARAYQSESSESIGELTAHWLREIFGVEGRAYIAPSAAPVETEPGFIAVSLGVGGNPAKRVPDPFESELMRGLVATGCPILIDHGAGGEESERVERAVAASGAGAGQIRQWRGAFAPFAAAIARASLYVGYDSSGQHVAAACGTPLVTVFAGAPNERFKKRWRPTGTGPIEVIDAEGGGDLSRRALDAVAELLPKP
ncbi:MAG: glycosyltransferase family 9 protein [Bryobacteraceae bacterium]